VKLIPKPAPAGKPAREPGVLAATIRLVLEFIRHVVVNDVLRPIGVTLLIWALVVLAAQRAGENAQRMAPPPAQVHEATDASPWMHR
jgi:hypothetical protein